MKDLCALLKVHPSTIYRMIKRGEIPHFNLGSDFRFNRESIEQWIRDKEFRP